VLKIPAFAKRQNVIANSPQDEKKKPSLNLQQTYEELSRLGIPEDRYYLHGLYGSTDDDQRLGLTIRRGKYTIEYEVYFRERGEKGDIRTFTDEAKATEYFVNKLFESYLFEQTYSRPDIGGMTVNERLFATGLMDMFDRLKLTDKPRARQLLEAIKLDRNSIDRML